MVVRGPNGIGKSSLIRAAAGLLPTSAGEIRTDGRVALVQDNLPFDTAASLQAGLRYWARIDGRTQTDVIGALHAMQIAHLAEVPVRMFSTGQRKRAALATVIAGCAEIWLLDEPGNGLDDDGLARLGDAITQHRASGGIIIAATHQPLPITDALTVELGSQ
jgi:heme exporter protein A